jgi:hypothetical protein
VVSPNPFDAPKIRFPDYVPFSTVYTYPYRAQEVAPEKAAGVTTNNTSQKISHPKTVAQLSSYQSRKGEENVDLPNQIGGVMLRQSASMLIVAVFCQLRKEPIDHCPRGR